MRNYDFWDGGFYYRISPDKKNVSVSNEFEEQKECYYDSNIIIPSSVICKSRVYIITKIDVGAFKGCKDIESIFIPNGIEEIGEEAFSGCTSLKSIETCE